jgi:hypothetical protein
MRDRAARDYAVGEFEDDAYLATLGFAEYSLAGFGPIAFFIEEISAGTSKMTDGLRGIPASRARRLS